MDVEFIGKDHSLRALELFKGHPETGQTLDAAGIVVFGSKVGALPHLADLMAPSPHGLRRGCQATCVLQGQGQRGTAPARAAPPIRLRGRLAQGQERPPEHGQQPCAAYRRQKLPIAVGPPPTAALPGGPHGAVDAGARAEQDRGDSRRGESSRAPHHDVEGQQGGVLRAAARPASGLAPPQESHRRCCLAWRGPLDT